MSAWTSRHFDGQGRPSDCSTSFSGSHDGRALCQFGGGGGGVGRRGGAAEEKHEPASGSSTLQRWIV